MRSSSVGLNQKRPRRSTGPLGGAGVHWRSDYAESVRLGERVALGILAEQKATYNEAPTLTLTTFDGETVEV